MVENCQFKTELLQKWIEIHQQTLIRKDQSGATFVLLLPINKFAEKIEKLCRNFTKAFLKTNYNFVVIFMCKKKQNKIIFNGWLNFRWNTDKHFKTKRKNILICLVWIIFGTLLMQDNDNKIVL